MLKLNYNDYGLFLEQVSASMDVITTQRVMLAIHAGETLYIEPGRAAFLLPANAPGIERLKRILQTGATGAVALSPVDSELVELSLKGTWIARSAQAEAGTFITTLTLESEALVYQLWQTTRREIARAA